MNERICVLCTHYHPRADPHPPDRGQTCAAGRRRLEQEVMALRSAYRRLLELERVEPGANDAASRRLPAAPVPPPSNQPNVTGSKERRIPLTDVADLTAAAQLGGVTDPFGDQVGHHSVATVLNEWVRAWHERYFANQTRPAPEAGRLFGWLLGVRLELVCDADPAITDFAAEVGELRGLIRRHLGETTPKKQPMWGVPCPRCDLMSQLMLGPEDPDKYRECANCGKLMTQDEYLAHLRELVDQYRSGQKLARGQVL
jgi:Zn ribbon nucleic-acid-binding protein